MSRRRAELGDKKRKRTERRDTTAGHSTSVGARRRELTEVLWRGKWLQEDDDDADGRAGGFSALPKKVRYGLAFVGAFLVLFTFFALILWGASRNQKPVVSVNVRTPLSFPSGPDS